MGRVEAIVLEADRIGAEPALTAPRPDSKLAIKKLVAIEARRPAAAFRDQSLRIGLKGCVIEGPLGLVGAAVKTAAPDDDSRLEDWLSVWRRAQDS